MESCVLARRVVLVLAERIETLDQEMLDVLLDVIKYLKRECDRERMAEDLAAGMKAVGLS